ncbi:helix-turn-helix domain-containing protein [Sphingomonas canadensis]|uniref:Helix-turn-helix domain-containing protein n=1 Tax=Sphingomonas canadensis TaxID=1219257 RepID=A0ABW3H4B1_9SPHN|nr:helix-turn-helix domain-containing protein [Sphingomonas canadensis]MCW3835999.1 hypothetical protein [Sphingomonas canadensis]
MSAARAIIVVVEGEGQLSLALSAINAALVAPELKVWRPRPVIGDLIDLAARETNLPVAMICGQSRDPAAVRARQAICWVAHRRFHRSLSQIGVLLGGRDHSTIHNAVDRADARRTREQDFLTLTERMSAAAKPEIAL